MGEQDKLVTQPAAASEGIAPKVPAPPNADHPRTEPPPSPPVPRGPRLRILIVLVVAVLLALAAGMTWHSQLHALVGKVFPPPAQAQSDSEKPKYYTCGMHPWVILPKPGECPICHMTLIPLDPSKFSAQVEINPVMAQNIGIRVAPVVTGPVTSVIRTVGNVDYNETLVRDVNLKIGGWVSKLKVDYVGKPVEKGQPLLEIYSPELYTAQEEYLNAFKNHASTTKPAASAELNQWDNDLLDSARKRLENYDISPQQIKELERSGKSSKTMTISSPYHGLVIAKNANEGMKVEPGTQLYRIADLSKVWIMVTLYEYQIPFIQLGQEAVMTLPYLPGQTFQGKITYIYPYISQESRQIKVRMEFDNRPTGADKSDWLLKPGMFANVELRSTMAQNRILVPREAVVDTGNRQVAFVSLGEGRFDPRPVKVGVEAENGMIEILDGLKPNDLVVTSGNFLLDSEARLRDALGKMVRGELASDHKTAAATAGASELTSLPQDVSKAIISLMDNYFAIGAKLSDDAIDGIAPAAKQVAADADALIKIEIPDSPHFWHTHMEIADIRGKALELVETNDIAVAREKFADLSTVMAKLLMATGVPPSYGKEVQELHCPMYRKGQGGTWWLQVAGATLNPYYGKSMLDCKDNQLALPVTGAKSVQTTQPAPTPQPSAATSQTVPPATTQAALSIAAQLQVDRLVVAYLDVAKLLAADKTDGVSERLTVIADAAKVLADEARLKEVAGDIAKAAAQKTSNIDEMRLAYKSLSNYVIKLVQIAPQSAKVAATLYQINCPMTKGDWLQTTTDIANPYYGHSMLTCGSVVATFKSVPAEK